MGCTNGHHGRSEDPENRGRVKNPLVFWKGFFSQTIVIGMAKVLRPTLLPL